MGSNQWVGKRDHVVKRVWGEWLDSLPWTLFLTITYDWKRHVKSKCTLNWPRDPIDTLKGGHWAHITTGAVRSALFVEPFQKIDGYHLHGLLYVPNWTGLLEPRMEALEKRLDNKFGSCKVLPAWAGGAARYVSKYAGDLDTAGIEFDLFGDWDNS